VQAHAIGEVGILGTVLLRVYSGRVLAIFIEIGSYLTDKEQKISWHSFLRHSVVAGGEGEEVFVLLCDIRTFFVWLFYDAMISEVVCLAVVCSHDGQYIICGSEDQCVYIWRTQHEFYKFSSARRDRSDYWESVKGNLSNI